MLKKNRTLIAGLVVIGVAIGSYFSGIFRGFGEGAGDGPSDGGTNVQVTAQPSGPSTTPASSEWQTPESDSAVKPADDGKVLEVRVYERSYGVKQIEDGKVEFKPIDLPQLVEMAKSVSGNDEGIRVRIIRYASARVLTWTTLEQELIKAGIEKTSIRVEEDLLPD